MLFGAAALAGAAIGPDRDEDVASTEPREHSEMASAAEHGAEPRALRGLAIAEDGLRVVVEDPELRRGREETLRFRIVDERGETVRDFDVEHEKRMHLILARRDLSNFQHLHPEQAADGSWSVSRPARRRRLVSAVRRLLARRRGADAGHRPAGRRRGRPAPAARARADRGERWRLPGPAGRGEARPGQEADLRFTITKDGVPVETEPYLGAGGHLVALRDGDLAFLHVHPMDDSVRFAATFPTEGRYRLFLQFKHEGRVQTVAFTQEVS